jgi:hypothetical protein
MDHSDPHFTLTIHGLEALEKFVAIIRGEPLAKLAEGAAHLRQTTRALAASEAAAAPDADVST